MTEPTPSGTIPNYRLNVSDTLIEHVELIRDSVSPLRWLLEEATLRLDIPIAYVVLAAVRTKRCKRWIAQCAVLIYGNPILFMRIGTYTVVPANTRQKYTPMPTHDHLVHRVRGA